MLTSLIIDGILKLVWVRRDSNKQKMVCRIYPIVGNVPEKIINEVIPGSGLFRDSEGRRFKFTGERMVCI